MKNQLTKFFILLCFTCTYSHSQENKSDPVNKYMLEYLKKHAIESGPERSIIRGQLNEIISKTTDSVVKNGAIKYLSVIEALKFDNSKRVNLNSIPKENLKNFKVKTDKFTSNTFITHKNISISAPIQAYIVVKNDEAFLRITTHYEGSSWLFMNKCSIILGEKKYSYDLIKPEREVNSNATVKEDADQIADENLIKILREITKIENDIEVRLEGNSKYYDLKLKARQIPAIKETYQLFESIK